MTEYKKIIPSILCKGGGFLCGREKTVYQSAFEDLGKHFSNMGADELLIIDLSENDQEHEENIRAVKELARYLEIPFTLGGNVNRFEDVKKYLYTGAQTAFLEAARDTNVDLIKEVADRFGGERIAVWIRDQQDFSRIEEFSLLGAAKFMIDESLSELLSTIKDRRFLLTLQDGTEENLKRYLAQAAVEGAAFQGFSPADNWMQMKGRLADQGIAVNLFESKIDWPELKTNADGLIPVIVQEYKTDQVLMMAYMNEESFRATIRSGQMTYYSRSRKELWLKGETSGHFQYVKALYADCDQDTLLAKVSQVGAACHTGSKSCFFRPMVEKNGPQTNPLKIFEDVYQVIADRREHPKEGSYTNYLFDKGIDKILKKVGEEATEIIIAAKNPDPEEIKYEISDFLYHVMVLMVEKGVSWEEIMKELAAR